MPEGSEITLGVILAGGRSSRMGQDKALLKFAGKTLLEHCTKVLMDSGVDTVLVSGGAYPQGIQDTLPDQGPLGGIHAILNSEHSIQARGLLIATVDMPAITSVQLRELFSEGVKSGQACIFEKNPFPMYLPNSTQVKDKLAESLVRGELAVRRWLDKIGYTSIEIQDPYSMTNVNRPEDWLRFNQNIQKSKGLMTNE